LPAPAGPFGAAGCIYHVGDPAPASCPAGTPYIDYRVYYSGKTDTRDCSSCSCASAAPVGGSCTGAVRIYSEAMCVGTPPMTYAFPAPTCQVYSIGAKPARVQADYALTPGACAAAGPSMPTGAVVGTGATVACCLP
jgi:hypothetical protein